REIVLTLTPAKPFAGFVKDQAGGPVVGARVQFGSVTRQGNMTLWGYPIPPPLDGTPLEKLFVTQSDAAGRFQFPAVPAGKELIFRVEAAGLADFDTAARGPTTEYKAGTPPPTFTLAPEAQLRGRVVSRVNGVKVGGLGVWLQGAGRDAAAVGDKKARTDDEGRFQIGGLGAHTVNVHLDAPPPGSAWAVRAAPTVTPRPGEVTDVEIELIEGVVVEGQVTVADSTEPVERVWVGVHGPARPM